MVGEHVGHCVGHSICRVQMPSCVLLMMRVVISQELICSVFSACHNHQNPERTMMGHFLYGTPQPNIYCTIVGTYA